MSENFGIESHGAHVHGPLRAISRFLVVIQAGDEMLAKLFDAERRQVAEFDASTEEVGVMIRGLTPARGASGAEWNHALASHSDAERAAAEVFGLDV